MVPGCLVVFAPGLSRNVLIEEKIEGDGVDVSDYRHGDEDCNGQPVHGPPLVGLGVHVDGRTFG